jgi:murein DD-endopeptidase MepM/ murein hydrolase activator NlpD
MIFPQLKNKIYGYINLNLEVREWLIKKDKLLAEKNPLLNPKTCQEMIMSVHEKYGLDFSYGGWMEDRSLLWKGSYLEEQNIFSHLGIDLNVPAGTEIAADFNAEVIKIDTDYPRKGGWGSHVFLKHLSEPVCLIYAHLDPNIKCKVGDKLEKGQVFAVVGQAPQNGKWYPHIHIQVISDNHYKKLVKHDLWEAFDGYGKVEDIRRNSRKYPDPLRFISFV